MMRTKWAFFWFLFGSVLSLSSCGSDPLERMRRAQQIISPNRAPSSATFATLDPQIVGNQYKFVFVVDESGSNASGNFGGGGGTDPTGSRRFDNIVKFVDSQIQSKTDAGYALVAFGDAGYLVQDFTNDAAAFRTAVVNEKAARRDNQSTNFVAALTEANTVIASDAARCMSDPSGEPSFYVVFHISDGVPEPAESDAEIKTVVDSLMGLAQGANSRCVNGVVLHTGFYHNGVADPTAPEAVIMSKMATWGKGQFIDFSDKAQIDLTRYRIPQLQIQMRLVDVMIANMNTVWEDGVLKLDSDGDGLSDELEAKLGSNPHAVDSDGNGISDYVENYLYRRPCNDAKCSPDGALDFVSGCGDLLQSPKGQSPVVFKDSDGGGLNDCEKRLLGGRLDRWDSNGDWIPDCLEFFRGMNFIAGTHQENADPFNNGITNREKLKRGMPIDIDAKKIPTFTPYDYTLIEVGRSDRGIEYAIEIKDIPVIGDGNRIRVYVFENTLGVKDMRFMRIAEKPLAGSSGVTFVNGDFHKPVQFSCSSGDPCF